MNKSPAFQLYAADFLVDTIDWSNEELGAYLRLLTTEWVNGPLPNDPKKLQKITQTSSKKWQKIAPTVLSKFQQNGDKKLVNPRLEKTRQEQLNYRESQREAGKKGVEKKRKLGIYPFADPSTDPSTDPSSENQALQSSSSSSKKKEKEEDISIPIFKEEKILLRLITDEDYFVSPSMAMSWQKTYPKVNVIQELREMVEWCKSNPKKRKTQAGIRRFITTWLSKEQDKIQEKEQVADMKSPKPRGGQQQCPECQSVVPFLITTDDGRMCHNCMAKELG